jgi:hypothetical protein
MELFSEMGALGSEDLLCDFTYVIIICSYD